MSGRHDELRRAMRERVRYLLDMVAVIEQHVARLTAKERELALADGVQLPRVVALGHEVHPQSEADHLLLDPFAPEVGGEPLPVAAVLSTYCEDCGAPHDKPVHLSPAGADTAGVPVLWDGQVLPGGPH